MVRIKIGKKESALKSSLSTTCSTLILPMRELGAIPENTKTKREMEVLKVIKVY
jgi:hypothetical protein